MREVGADPAACVDRAWLIALARHPTETERTEALRLMEALASEAAADESAATALSQSAEGLQRLPEEKAAALAKLCLAIFNLNEFLFID